MQLLYLNEIFSLLDSEYMQNQVISSLETQPLTNKRFLIFARNIYTKQ